MKVLANIFAQWKWSWQGLFCIAKAMRHVPGVERVFQSLLYRRCRIEENALKEIAEKASPEGKVMYGPFSGMVYADATAAGSMFCPKIFGTYEREIAHLFHPAYLGLFDAIIDVGCAEGYYAVGCALRSKSVNVIAYDTSAKARDLCRRMAKSNHVEHRITIHERCDSEDLRNLVDRRALIISDCEGYEMQLFSESVLSCVADCDLIIEIHPQYNSNAVELQERFAATHATTLIWSVPDLDKPELYAIPELEGTSLSVKVTALAECRPCKMGWLHARSLGHVDEMSRNGMHDFDG